jgi:pimeloyl-ACP methyl ester carboxylesterase
MSNAYLGAYNSIQGYLGIHRSFISFDTSIIPANADVTSAKLVVVPSYVDDEYDDAYSYMNVLQSFQASSTALSGDDIETCGNTLENPTKGAADMDLSSILVEQPLVFELNEVGTSWIDKSGYTKLCIREGHDIENKETINNDNYWRISGIAYYSSEETGESKDPYLEITFEVGDEEGEEKDIYELLEELIGAVEGYEFGPGVYGPYMAHLGKLEDFFNSAKYAQAEEQLNAFLKKLKKDFEAGTVSEAQYDDLLAKTNALLAAILAMTVDDGEPEPNGASSILFLPGIQASRLYKDGLLGTEDQLWEPNRNQDISQLAMTASGESIEDVYTRDILDEVFGIKNVYQGFEDFLDALVADAAIEDWEAYAYDWRYSVNDIATNGTRYEDEIREAVERIEALAQDSFTGKVTLIGHSNGGLLAKAIMAQLERVGKSEYVDRVIFIGTPQLGTPKAVASLLHGYDQSSLFGLIMNAGTVREVTRNMPGAHGLIPSPKYFDVNGTPFITFREGEATEQFRNAYGESIDTSDELLDFMTGEADGREDDPDKLYKALTVNRAILESAYHDHEALLDDWAALPGIKVVEIVGVGLNTLSGIEYREFKDKYCVVQPGTQRPSCVERVIYKPYPLFTPYGDETVVAASAEAYEGENTTYYLNLRAMENDSSDNAVSHADITESDALQSLVKNVLIGKSTNVRFVEEDKPSEDTDWLLYGVHSPVSLSLVDPSGNTVERGDDVFPSEEIPGSRYFELGGSAYVMVPEGGTYSVRIKGTDFGSVTLTLEKLQGDARESIAEAYIATITPSTTIHTKYQNGALANLSVDEDGDGTVDVVLTPEGEVVSIPAMYAELYASIQELPLARVYKNYLVALTHQAEALDTTVAANPKLEPLEVRALNDLEATLRSYVEKGYLAQSHIDPLLAIIDTLTI